MIQSYINFATVMLEQAGWDCPYSSDLDPAAVATLKANQGFKLGDGRKALEHTKIEQRDIRLLTGREILAKIGITVTGLR